MNSQSQLHFELGDFQSDSLVIRLSRGRLLYRRTMLLPPLPFQVIDPCEEQWSRFWQEVDRIGVWSWHRENYHVLDGTSWSLHLSHGGRKVRSEGSYGNLLDGESEDLIEFLQALGRLTGKSIG